MTGAERRGGEGAWPVIFFTPHLTYEHICGMNIVVTLVPTPPFPFPTYGRAPGSFASGVRFRSGPGR